MNFDLTPEGIDPVRIGMTVDQARSAMERTFGESPRELINYGARKHPRLVLPMYSTFEAAPDKDGLIGSVGVTDLDADVNTTTFRGIEVFTTPARSVIAAIRGLNVRVEKSRTDDSYELIDLGIWLWHDEDNRTAYFNAAGVTELQVRHEMLRKEGINV